MAVLIHLLKHVHQDSSSFYVEDKTLLAEKLLTLWKMGRKSEELPFPQLAFLLLFVCIYLWEEAFRFLKWFLDTETVNTNKRTLLCKSKDLFGAFLQLLLHKLDLYSEFKISDFCSTYLMPSTFKALLSPSCSFQMVFLLKGKKMPVSASEWCQTFTGNTFVLCREAKAISVLFLAQNDPSETFHLLLNYHLKQNSGGNDQPHE